MIDRIYCRNFRRIGECDIPIREGITTIIGKNGTGKSSVIESITFNLFGEVAKGKGKKESCRRANAPEDDPTYTVIDFTYQGVHYRCRRWYTKKMSMNATLFSYTDDEYEQLQKQPMTEHNPLFGTEVALGASGVTVAITDILKLNYKGFLASFLAQQKELDSFKSLAAEKRKEFFLQILGYDRLDKMKLEIGSMVKATNNSLSAFDNQQQTIPQIQADIEKHEKALKVLDERIAKGEQYVKDAEARRQSAEEKYNECRLINERVSSAQQEHDKSVEEKAKLESEIARLNQSIIDNKAKSEGYDANSSIAERLAQATDKMSNSRKLDEVRRRKEEAEGSQNDRKKEYEQNAAQIAKLEELTKTEPSTTAIQERITTLKSQKSAIVQQRKTAELGRKKMQDLLDSVNTGQVASCPTCGTEISSADGKTHLGNEVANYEKQIADAQAEEAKIDEQLTQADRELENENRRLATYRMNSTEKEKLIAANAELKRTIDSAAKTLEDFAKEEQELAPFKMARDEQLLLNDQIAHLQQQRQREDEMRKAFNQVTADEATLKAKQEALAKEEKNISEKAQFVKEHKREASKLEKLAEERTKTINNSEKFSAALLQLTAERGEALSALSTDKGNLKSAEERAERLTKLKLLLTEQIGAQQVIGDLRANLPGRIAPRLAETASYFLDIATNGRYSMVEISDNYEVFVYADNDIRPIGAMSGGEADVISLCIRIAIAKMLLEASGMPSQTFILDEIFGALDDERRESTCVALQNIQTEMQKIICITHIDEIKDMADWTFVIEMDDNNVSYSREIEHDNTLKSMSVEAALAEAEKIIEDSKQKDAGILPDENEGE